MKKIYKANGHTFNTIEEVEKYAFDNGFKISDTDEFNYRGKTIVCVNLKSI